MTGPIVSDTPEAKVRILIVCTANRCRSPIAEALLGRRLQQLGVDHVIRSCGRLGDGSPPPAHAVSVMRGYGLNIENRPSRPLDAATIATADVIITMERAHILDVSGLGTGTWPRTFSLHEIARRATRIGPRTAGETFPAWIARLHAGRTPSDALFGDTTDDVADPIGGPEREFRDCAVIIDTLLGQFVAHAFPAGRSVATPSSPFG